MPIKIGRDPNSGFVLSLVLGKFLPEEFQKALDPYYASTPQGAHLFVLLDLSRVTEPPTAKELLAEFLALGKARPSVPTLAAVVSQADLGQPPGRMLRPVMSDVGLKLMVFATPAEAKAWLLSGLE